jgi:hypothetical protein
VTTSLPTCGQCGGIAADAIFVPSLADVQYVVAVCGRHDLMGDGERFSLDAMSENPAAFLAAFDKQHVEPDESLRGWLVERTTGAKTDVLDVLQAAAYLKCDPETVRRRVKRGEIAELPRSGKTAPIRIRRDALDATPPTKRRVVPRPAPQRSSDVEWPK